MPVLATMRPYFVPVFLNFLASAPQVFFELADDGGSATAAPAGADPAPDDLGIRARQLFVFTLRPRAPRLLVVITAAALFRPHGSSHTTRAAVQRSRFLCSHPSGHRQQVAVPRLVSGLHLVHRAAGSPPRLRFKLCSSQTCAEKAVPPLTQVCGERGPLRLDLVSR